MLPKAADENNCGERIYCMKNTSRYNYLLSVVNISVIGKYSTKKEKKENHNRNLNVVLKRIR